MEIPISCGKCQYGSTMDLSIDDLVSYCKLTNCTEDWCDFPHRNDGTLRMRNCPLDNKSE